MESEQKQLLKLIGDLMNEYGKLGRWTKPDLTKSGRITKDRKFIYPNESELLEMWDLVKNNDYDAALIFNRIYKLKLDLL